MAYTLGPDPQCAARRRCLKALLAAGLGFCAPRVLGATAGTAPNGMRTRAIPRSGELLPVVGLGTSDAFETASHQDLAPLRDVLDLFVELGGRLIDTSPTYGNAESVVGRLATELGIREQLFMASKVHEYGEAEGIEQLEDSERLLGGRPLDLQQVHNLVDLPTQLATLRRWKDTGRIRYLGITHYRVPAFEELERLMRTEDLDFVQFNYSVVTPDAEARLLPLAQDRGQAVLINRAYEDGRWFERTRGKPLPDWVKEFDCASWGQFALKYVLSHPAVTCVIPATSKTKHLADNMAAGSGDLPNAAMRRRMRDLVLSL